MDIRSASSFRTPLRNMRLILSLLCLTFLCAATADAQVKRWPQPDSVPALQKVYNVEDDEFIVGALYNKPLRDAGDTIGIAWTFARWLNASDWIWTHGFKRITTHVVIQR